MPLFSEKLSQAIEKKQSLLCVGLDPDLSKIPKHLHKGESQRGRIDTIVEFCCAIVDASKTYAVAYKPQIAYFSAQAAESALEQVISHIRIHAQHALIVLDAKRGDIGPTALQYAHEAFARYQADAVTLSPYLGADSIKPYQVHYPDKGLFLLCRTSNASSADLQLLKVHNNSYDPQALYTYVAQLAQSWDRNETQVRAQIGLVVGATQPEELKQLAQQFPELPMLIPGIGAQGGDLAFTITHSPKCALINASRSILYASAQEDFAQKAAAIAQSMQQEMAALRFGDGGILNAHA